MKKQIDIHEGDAHEKHGCFIVVSLFCHDVFVGFSWFCHGNPFELPYKALYGLLNLFEPFLDTSEPSKEQKKNAKAELEKKTAS